MQENQLKVMQALVERLNQASDAYYNGQGELMSDHEWDATFDELKKLEEETGTILPDSPTINVSADDVAGAKEEHEFATLSLAKTKKIEDLVKWAEHRPIWLSWKLDGLTLVVTYDNGTLTKVVTRGNGHVGTNITHLSKAIDGILPTINNKGHLVIRGEAVISYADFEQFNMEADEEYANPRNLASGSLTLKDVNEVKARHIRWIPFTLVYSEEDINSWGKQMEFLESNGFKTVEHELIAIPTFDNIDKVIGKWSELVINRTNPYPVDGLVISYDDTAYAASGSVTGHHATRAGYAFKWQDESAETELDYIEWSCAASTISPVAVFRPVELEGTTVRRASLCNISECERLGIGDKGTRIAVIKANKIIPKVINVVEKMGTFAVPDSCPVCKARTEVVESESSGTKTLHCTNTDCPAKQLKKFARFVSKEGVNIDGLSEQTVQKFINLGWVSEYSDLFQLQEHANELRLMDGFGAKSVANLLKAIEKARKVEARQLLFALNIPLIGQDVCTRLLATYPLSELIDKARTAKDPTLLSTIDGIGPEKSSSFVGWMQDTNYQKQLDDLLTQLEVSQTSTKHKGTLCQGLTFVVTGDVEHYKNRNELKAYIESQGGKVTGSVSKSTSFLINNNTNSSSGKNQKAKQLGIEIISEEQFIERFT
ncbi:NAD-dependent DNA ligase LigA [Prevotella corporis]|uniref:NAD-dependent DNA ligase LigA n=1 Tax=Prevotella corporis TaxID=28128 RepID=UPI0023F4F4D7|nr:NAD-dependent DNA ligase LigA [Prevotella corporis]MDQ7737509.1 NAD-dependent DNA ligase LigA [Prevotella corporis]